MNREIDVFEYAGKILKEVSKGVLLTTKADDVVNTMTIAWGSLGIEWNKKIFTAYVRTSRYTASVLEKSNNFTVNISVKNPDKRVLAKCGSVSGRDIDKIKENNLTLIASELISSPAIKEFPLTLECKILYSQLQDESKIPEAIKERFYPKGRDTNSGENDSYHIAYYAEIIKAYIIE